MVLPSRRRGSSRRSARSHSHDDDDDFVVASSSRLTPSRRHNHTNRVSPSPDGVKRLSFGRILSSAHTNRNAEAAKRAIDLLDESESSQSASQPSAPAQSAMPQHDSDEIVTPELPPADYSAPALPDIIESLPNTQDLPALGSPDHDSPLIGEAETVAEVITVEATPSPQKSPPPDRLADQRLLFDENELAMQPLYDELKMLLDTGNASGNEDDDDEDYEERRQRKLRANEALLAQLGLTASGSRADYDAADDAEDEADHEDDDETSQLDNTPRRGRGRPKKSGRNDSRKPADIVNTSLTNKKRKYVKFFDDGTTKMAPPRGETFVLAYIEMPTLRDRARNDYVFIRDVPDIRPEDLITWSEDEEEEEEEEDSDVADEAAASDLDFGQPRYDILGRAIARRRKRQPDVLADGTVMTTCHQCRRKTGDIKMKCHRMRQGLECTFFYCRRCITARYGIDFNPTDLNFHCPRCLGYCNCTICLRRSGLGDLIPQVRQRVLDHSDELKVLAKQAGIDSIEVQERIAAILAEAANIKMQMPPPTKRRKLDENAIKEKKLQDPDAVASSPAKRRGRPPKLSRELPPIKLEILDLSDEVAEGDVFSALEEHALGRLSVARRVLNLIEKEQASRTADRVKLIVRLKRPSRQGKTQRTFPVASAWVSDEDVKPRHQSRTLNYHDMEKQNVWVRGPADYSTSESEVDELAEFESDAEVGQDQVDTVFEEGRTQVFASSRLGQSAVGSENSRTSSPLTSLNEDRMSSLSASSSHFGEEKGSSQPNATETSTQGSAAAVFPSTSLDMPQDMQQLALAVLQDHGEPGKALLAPLVHDGTAFAPSTDSEVARFRFEADPPSGTPVYFADSAYP